MIRYFKSSDKVFAKLLMLFTKIIGPTASSVLGAWSSKIFVISAVESVLVFRKRLLMVLILNGFVHIINAQQYQIDASRVAVVEKKAIPMEGVNPEGDRLSANSRYFEKNGKPWFPLMGEMHYNRIPHEDWESGILKMKAAGISVVATYVFWNEHETDPRVWDWTGNRDLRKFIELCGKHDMYIWLRIGPWAHGEQLHGGHPDWIAKMKGRRSNDPDYIAAATKLFDQIGIQVKGLFFEQGGPIIGIQLENEYANGQAAHITRLKGMAQAVDMHPVFWSVTANTVFDQDKMEVIPLQGSYCYRGWEKGGGGPTADFLYGDDQWIMGDALGKLYYDPLRFPRGLCEQGAGSQMTYTSRFVVDPRVEEAHLQNQIGRGMNLVGYYMFHGGTQSPRLKEPGYPESYDFQAPIGEFGIIRPSYKYLKILHHFINDFGTELVTMQQVEPSNPIRDVRNTKDLRYIARVKDNNGYVFLMNTQVRVSMPDKQVAISVKLKNETIQFPPVNLPAETNLVLPFNLLVNSVLIKYATAQPLAKIADGKNMTLFLVKPHGTSAPEMVVENSSGRIVKYKLSLTAPVIIAGEGGRNLTVVLLSREEAENSWRTSISGREAMIITKADLIAGNGGFRLQQAGNNNFQFKIYPGELAGLIAGGGNFVMKPGGQGSVSVPFYNTRITPEIKGKNASVMLPPALPAHVNDVLIKVHYLGGSCTVNQSGALLTDNLFNGQPWVVSTRNFLNKQGLHFTIDDWRDNITGVDEKLVEKVKQTGSRFEKIEALPVYSVDLNVKHKNNR